MASTRISFLVGLFTASMGAPFLLTSPAAAEEPPPSTSPAIREIEVIVDGGYKPGRIVIPEGERVRLKFIRKDYSPCTREVVFASLGIRRELPTNTPVVIELPAQSPGEIPFACGMNMVKGVIVVEPRK
ncbi:MAG TPA: cupredoxin domain-containing protein [Polyangiaceae bacterium]|nr:cupredoxin domain-containing protein [Polyangiaceae bacterium]